MFHANVDRQYTEFCIKPMVEIEIQEMNFVEKREEKNTHTQIKLLSFFNSLLSPIDVISKA